MKADKKFKFSFDVLEYYISKYREKDVNQIVYQLSYAGKFVIVKGKTLAGSLIIISEGLHHYRADTANKRFENHIYKHFFQHILDNEGRFRMKTLAKKSKKTDQYDLLKKEQMELDRNRFNPLCLNNAVEAYIPNYNENTGMYGWIEKQAVMSFKRWLNSPQRKAYIKRYTVKPSPTLANCDL